MVLNCAPVFIAECRPACLQHQQPGREQRLLIRLYLGVDPGPLDAGPSAAVAATDPSHALAALEVSLSRQRQVLLHARVDLAELAEQQQQRQHWAAGTLQRLDVHLDVPALPLAVHALDALCLTVAVASARSSISREDSSGGAAADGWRRPVPPRLVAAEVPLLVMPQAAQQEVQRLLLPALQQEVEAERRQQQHQQEQQRAVVDSREAVLPVECAAWARCRELAGDVSALLQLRDAVKAEGPADPGATALLAPASVALEQLSAALALPELLPCLAARGMHNTLQLVLGCLPPQHQRLWHTQQAERLQQLAAERTPSVGGGHLQPKACGPTSPLPLLPPQPLLPPPPPPPLQQ